MNIRKYLTISLGAAIIAAAPVSCIHDDNWDAPEIVCNNKFDAPTKTMAEAVALAPVNDTITIPNKSSSEPIIFDGYVVSSDENGNFYKTISFQDKPVNPTMGIQIEINKSMNYADFPIGAHIRIKANGLVIGKDGGVIKLGSRDPNYRIGRIPQSIIGRYMSGVCAGNGLEIVEIVPTVLTIPQIKDDKYINTLVKVQNVQFVDDEIGKELMNKDASGTYVDTNRNITDGTNNAIIRTDGFFRTPYVIPNKSGDITFVVSKYCSNNNCNPNYDNYQNVIRGVSDIDFTNTIPDKLLVEGFTNFTANGWTTYSVSGTPVWSIVNFGRPVPCAAMNGFGSANEDWLISKSISLAGYTSASFSFQTDGRYDGNPLEVYITTDTYSGGDPRSLNWTKLNAIFDTDMSAFFSTNQPWASSGDVSLNAYMNKDIRIAFKYTSTASAATSWELDNFKVIATK